MILVNTTPSAIVCDFTSELVININSVLGVNYAYFQNTTGRVLRPIVALYFLGAKADALPTGNITVRGATSSSSDIAGAYYIDTNKITFAGDAANTRKQVAILDLSNFPFWTDYYLFVAVLSDDAVNDDDVSLNKVLIYDAIDAPAATSAGYPSVNAAAVGGNAPQSFDDVQSSHMTINTIGHNIWKAANRIRSRL